jgi:hypothetical protein
MVFGIISPKIKIRRLKAKVASNTNFSNKEAAKADAVMFEMVFPMRIAVKIFAGFFNK